MKKHYVNCFIYNISQFLTFMIISLLRPREFKNFPRVTQVVTMSNVKIPSLMLHFHYKPPRDTNLGGWLWGPRRKMCWSYNGPISRMDVALSYSPEKYIFMKRISRCPSLTLAAKTKTHNEWPVGSVLKSNVNQ